MSKNIVTTVKLDSELYNRFKEINVRTKISLQEFVNKCIDTYIANEQFRNELSESIVNDNTFSPPTKVHVSNGNEMYATGTGKSPDYTNFPISYSGGPQRNIAGEPIR